MALPAKLRAPGWYRAAVCDVIAFAFAFGLTALIRFLMHQHPVIDPHAITKPYAYIPSGFHSGVMPSNFAQTLGSTQVQALVNYLSSVTK